MSKDENLAVEYPKKTPRKYWIRRPRFQYSISTLLLLTAVLAIWLGYVTNRARKQRAAVAALSAIGTTISYDWEFNDDDVMLMDAKPPGPEWLRQLIGDEYFQEVVEISLPGLLQPIDSSDKKDLTSEESDDPFGSDEEEFTLTEEHLNHLKSFTRLRSLYIEEDCHAKETAIHCHFTRCMLACTPAKDSVMSAVSTT
ncbi:MAG: hypothetical protein U9N87_07055, partial [Planctomycetota bacterium]|nr:hypothetical protein [Planctomycetota bacterium]